MIYFGPGIHLDIKEIEAWVMLFDTEGCLTGYTRVVYDSWYRNLVYRMAAWGSGDPEWKVRAIMAARLPLDSSCGMYSKETWAKIETAFSLLGTGDKIPGRAQNEACFALATQELRLSYDLIDRLKPLILE